MSTLSQHPETGNLTEKELKDSELILIHRELFTKLIKEKIRSIKDRKTALSFYDSKISKENIRLYYNRHISIFSQALLQDNLESIVKHNTYQ